MAFVPLALSALIVTLLGVALPLGSTVRRA